VVPVSTNTVNDNFDLLGYGLPPGTVVGTQSWSSHRDGVIFPSPDTFLPDRWLETHTDPSQLTLMHQHLMPFGAGSRLCGGQNLAHLVIRVVIAAVVRNFDIVSPPETNDVSMSTRDAFVS
jgi:cytochrome P450